MSKNEGPKKGIIIFVIAIAFVIGYASFNWEQEDPCVDPPWKTVDIGQNFKVKTRSNDPRLIEIQLLADDIKSNAGEVLFSRGNLAILEETQKELPIWIGCNGGVFAEIWGNY